MHRGAARIVFLMNVLLLVFSVVGCDQSRIIRKFAPPQDESRARSYVNLLRHGRFEEIETQVDASIQNSEMPDQLAAMAALFPPEAPVSVKVVAANTFHRPAIATTNITLEYEFPHKWLLVNVVTQRKDEATTLTGFHVTPIADSLEKLNSFTLKGKSSAQYAVLLLAVAAVILSFYAFVVCLRSKMGKRKWIWSILCLIGIGRLGINWTTGQAGFTPLSIQVPPAGASAAFYGPWMVYVALPVGAVLFFILRDRIERTQNQSEPADTEPTV